MKTQIRQGDIFLNPTSIPPDAALSAPPDHGRIDLAIGATTGHTHSLSSAVTEKWTGPDGRVFVRVLRDTELTHQEHSSLLVTAGDYVVIRQREFTPEAPRQVED